MSKRKRVQILGFRQLVHWRGGENTSKACRGLLRRFLLSQYVKKAHSFMRNKVYSARLLLFACKASRMEPFEMSKKLVVIPHIGQGV